MRFVYLCLLFLSISLPFLALGSAIEDLPSEISVFEEALDRSTEQGAFEAGEQERTQSKDLFPEGEGEKEKTREDDGGTFLHIPVDGDSVELTDVPRFAWFAPYIRDVAERGIVSGYRNANGKPSGFFGPENPVTIEELAKMTVIASGIDLSSCGGVLRNLHGEGRWSEDVLRCAEQRGFAVFGDGSVDPVRPALRSEVIVTILEALEVKTTPLSGTGRIFSDVSSSTEFASSIERAALDGVVSGFADVFGKLTGEFRPENPVNRAEVAKIFSLAIQVYAD